MNSRTPKIRTVASLLRKNTSTFPAPRFGRLHYRGLEKCKTITLCKSNGNFNARTHLTEAARSDIRWRKEKIWEKYNDIIVPNPDKCIATDASSYGWGAVMECQSTGDRFSTFIWNEGTYQCARAESNIIWFKSFRKGLTKVYIKVLTDNSTAVACIKNFGTGRSQECNSVIKDIWQVASDSSIWLPAAHLPGMQNTEADLESRLHEIHTEWKLNKLYFTSCVEN